MQSARWYLAIPGTIDTCVGLRAGRPAAAGAAPASWSGCLPRAGADSGELAAVALLDSGAEAGAGAELDAGAETPAAAKLDVGAEPAAWSAWTGRADVERPAAAWVVGGDSAPALAGAVLDGAVPEGAVPEGAVPEGAVPEGAVPAGSLLRPVLAGAVLAGAVLAGAVLAGAVLAGAVLAGAVLAGPVLRPVPAGAVLAGALPARAVPVGPGLEDTGPEGAELAGRVPAAAVPARRSARGPADCRSAAAAGLAAAPGAALAATGGIPRGSPDGPALLAVVVAVPGAAGTGNGAVATGLACGRAGACGAGSWLAGRPDRRDGRSSAARRPSASCRSLALRASPGDPTLAATSGSARLAAAIPAGASSLPTASSGLAADEASAPDEPKTSSRHTATPMTSISSARAASPIEM